MPEREPIDPGKYSFSTLMYDIENGRIRLPPFQREFVWNPSKVVDLVDSLYKGYPIGSFFYWKANRRYVTLFRDIKGLSLPPPAPDQELFFVLDGQQRLTSIWAVYKGATVNEDDYSQICLDLEEATKYEEGTPDERRQITVFQEIENDNKRYVALRDILGKTRVYDNIRDALPQDKKEILSRARDRFNTYPFSVVKVFDLELEDAVEVFQRINQGGKRLTRFELVAANCWSETFDLAVSVRQFNKQVEERTKFGKVEPITFIQAMSLLEFGQCKTEHELKLTGAMVQRLWPRVSKAIGDGIDWMRDNYGVIRRDMIPYDAMLAVLACYFAEHGTNVPIEHKGWIDRWFWRSTFSERYAKAQTAQLAADAKAVRELLDGKLDPPSFSLTIRKEDLPKMKINRASGARNGILCLLAQAKPKHFVNGTDISLAKDHFSQVKDPNAHHIFPKNFLKKGLRRYVEEVHLVPNFCYIPADLNKRISDRPPSEYFPAFKGDSNQNHHFEAALRSHLIPYDESSGIWDDDYDKFLSQRSELIWAEVLKLVGQGDIYDSAASVPRDVARLAVDEIEVKLRALVHDILFQAYGDEYWKGAIPSDVQKTIKDRIAQLKRSKVTTRIDDPYVRLQYADIMDYHKIIDKNWTLFENQFASRDELKSHFRALRNYRNPLQHVREMDIIDQKRGEAAIVWFRRILPSARLSDFEETTQAATSS